MESQPARISGWKRHPNKQAMLNIESLEARFCLTELVVSVHDVVTPQVWQVADLIPADIDGDHDIDLVATSLRDERVTWYENQEGVFVRQHSVGEGIVSLSIRASDLDLDGDLDLIAAGSEILFFENMDSRGTFAEPRTLLSMSAREIELVDIDDDEDLDLVAVSALSNISGSTSWFENLDGLGNFGSRRSIHSQPNSPVAVEVGDLDGNGTIDVVSSSADDDTIAWYPNQGDDFGPGQTIIGNAWNVETLTVVDLDSDGDLDVLSALVLHENMGNGTFQQIQLSREFVLPVGAEAVVDVDEDGDLDIIAASWGDELLAWYENPGALSEVWAQHTIAAGYDGKAHNLVVADLNGDGGFDLSYAVDDIVSRPHLNERGTFGQPLVVAAAGVNRPWSVVAGDIDGDGDLDIASASSEVDQIATFKNVDGLGAFGAEQIIARDELQGGQTRREDVRVADLDSDGNLDLVWVDIDFQVSKITWLRNLGGGIYSEPQPLIEGESYIRMADPADLDRDGDLDILFLARNRFAWMENVDGLGTFGTATPIAAPLDSFTSSQTAAIDIDGDGDLDVVAVINAWSFSSDENYLWWNENIGGDATFGPPLVIRSFPREQRIGQFTLGDVDRDDDPDVIVTLPVDRGICCRKGQEFVLLENEHGTFPTSATVGTAVAAVQYLRLGDLDDDGDLDLVTSEYDACVTCESMIAWLENSGQSFDAPTILSAERSIVPWSALGSRSLELADVDGDGDLDIVTANSGSNTIRWIELDAIQPADLDGDGRVAFSDFLILNANFGKQNARADEGDLDDDGFIGFSDFLILSATYQG